MKQKLVNLVVTISIPLIFVFIALQIVSSAWFLKTAYGLPMVPADAYGLTSAQRTDLAVRSLRILIKSRDAGELTREYQLITLPEGGQLFDQKEIEHLEDVRQLIGLINRMGVAALFISIAGLAWIVYREGWREGLVAVKEGSYLTLFILFGLGLFMLLAWKWFFTLFHQLFFLPDTWSFPAQSGLIRLFPEAFWQLVGATMVGAVLVLSLLLVVVVFRLERRQETT
jgi:integral membrane protein (TIGR01906 family)